MSPLVRTLLGGGIRQHRWASVAAVTLARASLHSSSARPASVPPASPSVSASAFAADTASGRTMRVLGVETSFDDTALAILDTKGNVLSHAKASQWHLFEQFAGIQPLAAAHAHTGAIDQVFESVLRSASLTERDLDGIAVTAGPGLDLCLKVGLSWTSALAQRLSLPRVGVHHMMAHVMVAQLDHPQLRYPFLALLLSGGHTELWLLQSQSQCCVLSETQDDAVGEAYDKVARMISVVRREKESPGAAVERLAAESQHPQRFLFPVLKSSNPHFSFCGLKSAVQREVLQLRADRRQHEKQGSQATSGEPTLQRDESGRLSNRTVSLLLHELRAQEGTVKQAAQSGDASQASLLSQLADLSLADQQDICAAFQRAVLAQLTPRVQGAIKYVQDLSRHARLSAPVTQLVFAGGVACNGTLRSALTSACAALGVSVLCPRPLHCTDNGIMIAHHGITLLKQGHADVHDLRFHTRWPVGPQRTLTLVTESKRAQKRAARAQFVRNDGDDV